MKLDLIDVRKLILVNGLKPVTNPILFESGNIPTAGGLLSTEIFGTTSRERKENYAFIDLKDYFIHPYVYKILKRVDRRIENIVYSTKKFVINKDGQLIEDEENGNTGIKWLYQNWDKLKFTKNDSNVRNERITLLEAFDKNIIFCKQWIVIPAFYRDVNFQGVDAGKISHNEITDMYCKLLKLANMLDSAMEFDFMLNSTKGKIQSTLVELYDYFKGRIEKKNGLIRRALLGKSIDYGVRAVIAAPEFKYNRYDDNPVDFWHAGVPVSMVCTLFYPFMLHELRNFFKEIYEDMQYKVSNLSEYDKKLPAQSVELADFNMTFGDDYFKKLMDVFTRNYEGRFDRIEIPLKHPQSKPIYFKIQLVDANGKQIERDMTITDALFVAAHRAASDKHAFITRYPVTNHLGSFPSKLNVTCTREFSKMSYRGTEFKFYPNIDLNMKKEDVATFFYDVLKMSNVLLKAIGGDYKLGHYCSL